MEKNMLNKNKKIHVVQIISALNYGGAERLVVDLSNLLVADNFDCSIITFFANTPLTSQLDKRVKVILVEKKQKLSFGLIKDLQKTLQNIGADIVHTHLFGADFWGSIVAKKLNLPVISTEHSVYRNESIIKNKLKYWNRKNIDKFVAVSKTIRQELQKYFKLPEEKIVVINPGIDLSRFLFVPNRKVVEPIKFLLLGRLEKEKNFAMAIEALSKYKAKNWQCQIVGQGSLEHNLQNLVSQLGLRDKIEFFSPTTDVVAKYSNTDILLLPSFYEGFGLVALEAMASARIVIATKVGVLPEVIIDKRNGLLCANISIESFADSLSWIFANQNKLLELGLEARQSIKKDFDISIMKSKYEEIYLDLCDKK